jgi:hypothetical protein
MSTPVYSTPRDYYASRLTHQEQVSALLERQSQRLSLWRGAMFLPALALTAYTALTPEASTSGYYLAGAFMLVFVVLAGIHERVVADLDQQAKSRSILRQHLQRMDRHLPKLPDPSPPVSREHQSMAADLDLVGRNSLFQWLCLAQTPLGRETLLDWLCRPAGKNEIEQRQQAIRRLASERDLREEFQIRGLALHEGPHGAGAFLSWAEGPEWLANHRTLKWTARFSIVAGPALIAATAMGWLPAACGLGVLAILIINTGVNLVCLPPIHRVFDSIASKQNEVSNYRELFRLVAEFDDDCPKIGELRNRMGGDGHEPLVALKDLHRRVCFATARNSAIWGLPYIVLQYFFLWDFHVLDLLEYWQRRHGPQSRQWFAALAEFEALLSLSGVAHDEPTWSFPHVGQEHDRLAAFRLGHPLIAGADRVANDVEVGPTGSFLLVTGSNMSGKSTLLRSLGLNVLMAQSGSPICATQCSLPPLEVATSMRVADSLGDGVSFYMAELQRLKEVVDHANQLAANPTRHLLYLLDEILLGTNSAERHIAVVRVMSHLLDANAMGAISTHDLALAGSQELANACQPVHFREQVITRDGKDEMTFDFVMRPGVATTTNALKLLEIVGLGERRPTS